MFKWIVGIVIFFLLAGSGGLFAILGILFIALMVYSIFADDDGSY